MLAEQLKTTDRSTMKKQLGLIFLIFGVLLSFAVACDRCVHNSKATHTPSSALSVGACGYKSLAFDLNGGYVAGGSSGLFRDGVGCGACFQIRCKNQALCTTAGVEVVLTDQNMDNRTGFVLASKAFSSMARHGMRQQLLNLGIVDVEYKRVPCEYENHNLSFRVEEQSSRPNYLAVKLLYQGGQTEVVLMHVARVGSNSWRSMTRDYGAVWSTDRAPTGPLQFRLVVTAGYDGKWVTTKEVLPAEWEAGVVYDSGVQITDIAQESCSPCDTSTWE